MQVLNLLIKPVWILLIDAAVQESLPAGVYGNYFGLFTFSLLFFIVLDFGLNTYNTAKVSRNSDHISLLTGRIIGFKIILSLTYLLIVFGVGYLSGYSSTEFDLLLLLCVIQILTSFNQFFRSIVAGLQKFKWDGIFMVLDRVILIVFCSVLLWGGIDGLDLTINRFVYAQIVGLGIVFCALVFFLFKHFKGMHVSFDISELKPIFIKSWPFAILISLMGLYNYIDGVMLERMVGDEEAGVYAMGYRFYFALLMFAQVFSGVLLPLFSKNIANVVVIKRVANYTFKLLFLLGVTAAFMTLVYGPEILTLRFPTKVDAGGILAFQIITFGFIGSSFVLVFGTLLTAALALKYLNITAFITLIINWMMNIILIPRYGAVGAAISTAVSQILFGFICYLLSIQQFELKLNFLNFSKQVLGVFLLFTVIVYGKQYFDNVIVHLFIVALTILLNGYLFRLYVPNQLKFIFRK